MLYSLRFIKSLVEKKLVKDWIFFILYRDSLSVWNFSSVIFRKWTSFHRCIIILMFGIQIHLHTYLCFQIADTVQWLIFQHLRRHCRVRQTKSGHRQLRYISVSSIFWEMFLPFCLPKSSRNGRGLRFCMFCATCTYFTRGCPCQLWASYWLIIRIVPCNLASPRRPPGVEAPRHTAR